MDPDVALANLRAAIARYNATDAERGGSVEWADVQEIVEGMEALDGWISSGGFLPAAWRQR